MKKRQDPELILRFKRICKVIKRESHLPLGKIHDKVARQAGFDDYHDLLKRWSSNSKLADFISTQTVVEFTH